MTKKLLCLILTIVMVIPMSTLGVTAAETTGVLIDETFDASLDLPEGYVFGSDVYTDMLPGEKCKVEGAEGNNYVVIERGPNDAPSGVTTGMAPNFMASAKNVTADHTILFDINRCAGIGEVYIRTDGATVNFKINKETGFIADKWYNICIRATKREETDGDGKVTIFKDYIVYYRERTEAGDGEWSQLMSGSAENVTMTARIFVLLDYEVGTKFLFDNYKLVVGTKVVSSEIDTTTYASEKIARATIKVASVDYAPGGSGTVTPILVAFDKKGQILAFEAQTAPLVFEPNASGDANTYIIDLDYSSFEQKLNGGTIEVYIWESVDSLSPMADPAVKVINLQ